MIVRTLVVLGVLTLLATPARASLLDDLLGAGVSTESVADAGQNSTRGVQFLPDLSEVLVNADVGHERWAIALRRDDVVTGNVFFASAQPPVFLWCVVVGRQGGTAPGATVTLGCLVGTRCTPGLRPAVCPAWTLGRNATLPFAFFLP